MQMNRRAFLGTAFAAGAAAATRGFGACSCGNGCGCGCGCGRPALPAVQLYSIRKYIKGDKGGGVGLAQALKDVAKIGYKGVEFAGYYDFKAEEIKTMLADAGLVACGTHVANGEYGIDMKNKSYDAGKMKSTCEFNLAYGNTFICCPGGGNMPPGWSWNNDGKSKPSAASDDFIKLLVEMYNKAAETAAQYGCKIGLHNHMWEFQVKMTDGTLYWDYFFSNTSENVCMEQDVGWTTCAGFDPCAQYEKYPHRSPTLHAKENGMGKNVTSFDAILGQPGRPGAVGVDWDKLIPATENDGVKWYVVECEKHEDGLSAVTPSYAFLKAKGLE